MDLLVFENSGKYYFGFIEKIEGNKAHLFNVFEILVQIIPVKKPGSSDLLVPDPTAMRKKGAGLEFPMSSSASNVDFQPVIRTVPAGFGFLQNPVVNLDKVTIYKIYKQEELEKYPEMKELFKEIFKLKETSEKKS